MSKSTRNTPRKGRKSVNRTGGNTIRFNPEYAKNGFMGSFGISSALVDLPIRVETWSSDHNEQERHFFHKDAYIMGINSQGMSDQALKKILAILEKEYKSRPFVINAGNVRRVFDQISKAVKKR